MRHIALVALVLLAVSATRLVHGTNVQSEDLVGMLNTLKSELKQNFRESMQGHIALLNREIKDIAEENIALRKELDSVRARPPTSGQDNALNKNEVMRLVSNVLDKHKKDVIERVERFEVSHQQSTEANGYSTSVTASPRRRLDSASSVLQDAALWMQAEKAKVLFGQNADVNLYRSAEGELTTDTDLRVKRDLEVWGENWHLTSMMEANENITVGDVVSLCNNGKACKGYGLEEVGYFQTSEKATDIGVIDLAGSYGINILYYRRGGAGEGAQSLPIARVMSPRHSVTGMYNQDPIMGGEKFIGVAKVSHLEMTAISETEFLMCYRKTFSAKTDTNIQLGVRYAKVSDLANNDLTFGDEVTAALYGGKYGIKRGIPLRLGPKKYAIVYETTDERDGSWLGTLQIAMGTLGSQTSGTFGVTLGSGEHIDEYASDASAAAMNDLKHVVVAYRRRNQAGTSDEGWVRLIDTSKSQASAKTDLQFSPMQSRFMDITRVGKKTVCLVYREPDMGFAAKGVLLRLNELETGLLKATAVPVAPASSIDNSYALSVSRLNDRQLVLAYRDAAGKPRIADADVVGTTIVVGRPRKFMPEDHVAATFRVVGVSENRFTLVYQDNEANTPHVATAIIGKTHGGALRTGVATTDAAVGQQVQVAIEGAVTVPLGKVLVNDRGMAMTPGARYYAKYDGGISPSSDDGVLLGRALRDELLLLERDLAGGFDGGGQSGAGGSSTYAGEIKALAGATVPAGWLPCDGRAIDRIAYSSLFAAIGETWGKGDGTTTFNIPDMRGRTMIGAGKGTAGGSVPNSDVTAAKPSEHKLGSYDGSEIFKFTQPSLSCSRNVGWSSSSRNALSSCSLTKSTLTSTSTRNNMSPYAAITYIIKT